MNENQGPRRLNRFSAYLPGFIKFYNVKNEYITPIVFILLLGANFVYTAISRNISESESVNKILDMSTNMKNFKYEEYFKYINSMALTLCLVFLIYVALNLIARIVTAVYLNAYIKDLKGEPYFSKGLVATSLRTMIYLILTSVDFYAAVLLGLALLVLSIGSIYIAPLVIILVFLGSIAWVVLKVFFVFTGCVVLDKGRTFKSSILSSFKLTEGNKASIILLVILFSLMSESASLFISSIFSINKLTFIFATAFLSAIINLMRTRLIAQMYVDLEYGQAEKVEDL